MTTKKQQKQRAFDSTNIRRIFLGSQSSVKVSLNEKSVTPAWESVSENQALRSLSQNVTDLEEELLLRTSTTATDNWAPIPSHPSP